MFQQRGNCSATYGGSTNNGVKRPQIDNNKISHTNQVTNKHLHHQSSASSFIKLFNPFSKSKSHNLSGNNNGSDKIIVKSDANCSDTNNKTSASVKVLKQFWNEQIKTAKSTENLCNNNKSATIKYFSQSNDSINEQSKISRGEKSLTLDGGLRLPLDDFNKYKDANFIRNKKIKLLNDNNNSANVIRHSHRPESFTLNDSLLFPQISSNGGKIHWLKREDIFTSSSKKLSSLETDENDGEVMSVKTNKANASRNNSEHQASSGEKTTAKRATRSDSVASSAGSIHSNTSSLNSSNRKFSFKTNPTTTASYMNKKLSSNGGSKVAQLAQRFNQMIQQDATILEEVKKRGTVVVHHSGGRVFKIKEEKVDKKKIVTNDESATAVVVSDDAISLPSIGGKNSTRRKSTLRKRPSIRVTVKDGNSSVLSKRQLYEANIVNKETIVLKPKVPDKSERVLAKTKELKSKKLNEILKTETHRNDNKHNKLASSNKESRSNAITENSTDTSNGGDNNNSSSYVYNGKVDAEETSEPIKDISSSSKNNLRKIYDKITFRPTFLYGKKANNKMTTTETGIQQQQQQQSTINTHENDRFIREEELMVAAESNKTADNIGSSNEIEEDDLDFKPIDLNLNVYFNNENLSKTHDDVDDKATGANVSKNNIENASIQGSINDVTNDNNDENDNKPDQPLMKPNESFLFSRTLSATKFDTFSFIRDMLDEDENLLSNENEIFLLPSNKIDVECNATEHENSYEIISRDDNDNNERSSECVAVDIDKNNNNNDDDNNKEERCDAVEENIYQSLCEVKGKRDCNGDDDEISIKSYESFENYDEIKQNILDNKINLSDILKSTTEDDYIFPEITLQPPELPAPRKNTVPKISSPILTSTTSNLVQANNLSVPKLQKSNSCTSTTYEKIKYDQLPTSKQQHQTNVVELPLPPRNNINTNNGKVTLMQQQKYNNENIYDTIKSSNNSRSMIGGGYEKIPDDKNKNKNNDNNKQQQEEEEEEEEISMTDTFDINDGDNPYKNSKNDTMSIISNCYESISLKQSYSTINQILRHAISSTTLTSEHRINSIYGESMTGQSLTPPSDRSGGSDNSDEWIDVDSEEEEEEEAENNDRFIV